MRAIILPYEFPSTNETTMPIDILNVVVKYCKMAKVDKVLVERPNVLATNSRSTKPVQQVNVDAFIKLMQNRGIGIAPFTLKTILGKNSIDMITNYEKQLGELINHERHGSEVVLVMVERQRSGLRPNVFGKSPVSAIPETIKPHGIDLEYISLTQIKRK